VQTLGIIVIIALGLDSSVQVHKQLRSKVTMSYLAQLSCISNLSVTVWIDQTFNKKNEQVN